MRVADTDPMGPRPDQRSNPIRAAVAAGSQTSWVAIADIDRSDMRFQFRLAFRTDDLLASIREQGQHTPVMLWGERPPYIVIDGFRRLEVLTQLGISQVNAIVEDLSESEAASLSFSANVRRKNLSAYDKASVIWCALNRWGMTREMIAEAFSLSRRQIERYSSLLRFDESLIRGVCERQITMAHAVFLHQARVEHPDRWVDEVSKAKLSVYDLRKRLGGRHRHGATYLVRDSRGFRLRPIRFRHDMSAAERGRIAAALESALRTAAESLYWESRRERMKSPEKTGT